MAAGMGSPPVSEVTKSQHHLARFAQYAAVIASAQFMLDHPIDDVDEAILRNLISDFLPVNITLSA
jgi:hypothetical protein